MLAKINSIEDPMTFQETAYIPNNVRSNNNLAWKNTSIVVLETTTNASTGRVIAIANTDQVARAYTLEFRPKIDEPGKSLHQEAEITISMDANLMAAWQEGGELSQEFTPQRLAHSKLISGPAAQLQNIQLDAGEITTAYISFNFLTKELTNKKKFIYEVLQRDAVTNEIIGGEIFEIRKKSRTVFTADAGQDKEIEKNESITLQASEIDENASYNWYDPEGNLIHSGSDLTLSPDVTKKYKLEIISDIDGLKDYDEVEVKVNPYKLASINPNPANSLTTVTYDAELATSAYLHIVNANIGDEYNYILDISETTIAIDTSFYDIGNYVVALICNGEFQSSKILVKQ